MSLNLDQARRLALPDELPAKKEFVPGIRRAPDRGFHLSAAQARTALKNALRYVPARLHAEIAPEFLDELCTRGRIYGYRYRPEGSLKAKPVGDYPGRILEARAFQVMIDNNLDFDVALYPYELVTYGETGQVFQNWMQYQLVKRYLREMTEPPDPGGLLGPPARPLPVQPRRAAGDRHQRPDGGHVRQPRRLRPGRGHGRVQLRADDGRRLDVHRPAGHRPRHLPHPAQRRAPVPGHPRRRGPGRRRLPQLGAGRHERRPAQGRRDRRRQSASSPRSTARASRPGTSRAGCQRVSADLDEVVRWIGGAPQVEQAASPSPTTATSSTCWEYVLERGIAVELASDQTSCHAPYDGGYTPAGIELRRGPAPAARGPGRLPPQGRRVAACGSSG